MSRKKYAVIIPVILAIVVGHFLIQISFIESENKRIVETLIKTPPVENPVLVRPQIEPAAVEPNVERTDTVTPNQPLQTPKPYHTVKVAQREQVRRAQLASEQNTVRREPKREVRTERLRRAEKILTGF